MQTFRRVLACALTLTSLAACAGGEQDAAVPSDPPTAPQTTASQGVTTPPPSASASTGGGPRGSASPSEASAPSAGAAMPRPEQAAVALEQIGEADQPVGLLWGPNGLTYAIERPGRVVPLGGGEPLLDISDRTTTDGERGLLGAVFSADGDWLYVSFTDTDGNSRVEAFPVSGGQADPDGARELLRVEQPYSNHNGGHVALGPDGALYLGLGDGGAGGDPQENGQDPTTLLGSLLRIEPTPEAEQPYAIPDDNPFADGGQGRAEIVAYGLRNPWRFSFDRETDELWIGDVGQNAVEEIDRIGLADLPGANFGWDDVEGDQPFEGEPSDAFVSPVFTYAHGPGCSVTGGYVYRGQALAELRGAYVYGDLCEGAVRALTVAEDGQATSVDLGLGVNQLVSFDEGPDGQLYVLSLEGPIYRLIPADES